jgi:hypothetical protein
MEISSLIDSKVLIVEDEPDARFLIKEFCFGKPLSSDLISRIIDGIPGVELAV